MPLPLGHFAIGYTTQQLFFSNPAAREKNPGRWVIVAMTVVLANLPDIDVLLGLLWRGNGMAFHRGPTHSLLFAVLAGLVCCHGWRITRFLPHLRFGYGFAVVLSHVMADALLTDTPVSLLWPLEIYWSIGHSNWADVLHSVFLRSFQDIWIVVLCAVILLGWRWLLGTPAATRDSRNRRIARQ